MRVALRAARELLQKSLVASLAMALFASRALKFAFVVFVALEYHNLKPGKEGLKGLRHLAGSKRRCMANLSGS